MQTNSRKYLLANEDTYRNLSTFETVAHMDEAIRTYKAAHTLTKGEHDVLEVLTRHSCKYPGVSFMTNTKLGEIVGKRRETVSRIRTKLTKKGFIKQYPLKRDGGDRRETGSAAVIIPVETEERTPSVTPKKSHHKASHKTNYKTNTHTRDEAGAGKRALRQSIPKAIYDALAPFYDVNGLYNTYGVLLRAKASIDRTITFEDHAQAYIDVFVNVIRKLKRGEVRKLDGLLYSAWQKVTAEVSRRVSDCSILSYDWLNDAQAQQA